MADIYPTVAESSRASATVLSHNHSSPSHPIRSDTWSSDGSFQPIEPGRWILDIHGNCPRCHHHHSAVQVKVKVSPDGSQVSHVHCEECDQKWAAFGGNNTTRISLLSSTTTEPDTVNEEVRDGLISLIQRVTTAESLGGITEQANTLPGSESSPTGAHSSLHTADNTLQADDPPISTETGSSILQAQHNLPSASENVPSLSRSKSGRLLGYVRLRREILRRWILQSKQPNRSTRRLQKSAIREQPAADLPDASEGQLAQHFEMDIDPLPTSPVDPNIAEVDFATKSHASPEATVYLQSRDTTGLGAMHDTDRAAWLRENYTDFKGRHSRSNTSAPPPPPSTTTILRPTLTLSAITGVSIDNEPLFHRRVSSLHSADVSGAGGVAEGLRHSISNASVPGLPVDQQTLEALITPAGRRYSGQEMLRRARRGIGSSRPQSLPNARRSLPQYRHLSGARTSFDSSMWNGDARSESSSMGAPSIRSSRATTICNSTSGHTDPYASQTSFQDFALMEVPGGDETDEYPPSLPSTEDGSSRTQSS